MGPGVPGVMLVTRPAGEKMEPGDGSYYEISPGLLAEWIENQGADRWWRVDGDPLLTGLLSFPCPGDELADKLRRIQRTFHRTLQVHGRGKETPHPGELTWRDLDAFTEPFGALAGDRPTGDQDRMLVLRWNGDGDEWLLIEDEGASEFYRREAASQGRGS